MPLKHRLGEPAAIVLGGVHNALAQIRALGRAGIEVYYAQTKKRARFVQASRYCRVVAMPDVHLEPQAAVAALNDLASSLPLKPLLFQTEDVWMFAVGQHEADVLLHCRIPSSPWTVLQSILNKRKLYETARSLGIPFPRTQACANLGELEAHLAEFPVPCVVKPEVTLNFLERLPDELRKECGHRTRRFNGRQELRVWCQAMLRAGVDVPAIVQDFIPGGAETLYTLTSYSDRSGRMVVGSVGHKVRQMPPDAGCIVSGRLRHEPVVYDQGRRLLDGLGFHGLANTEFKYDPRDDRYKLMEINPRLGKWNGSALAAGLNLPLIAYDDLLGRRYQGPAVSTRADGALWLDFWEDGIAATYGYWRNGYASAHLGILGWLRAIRGPRISAVWSPDDPMPAAVHTSRVLASLGWAAVRMLVRKAKP